MFDNRFYNLRKITVLEVIFFVRKLQHLIIILNTDQADRLLNSYFVEKFSAEPTCVISSCNSTKNMISLGMEVSIIT